jgi:hypothetical protein
MALVRRDRRVGVHRRAQYPCRCSQRPHPALTCWAPVRPYSSQRPGRSGTALTAHCVRLWAPEGAYRAILPSPCSPSVTPKTPTGRPPFLVSVTPCRCPGEPPLLHSAVDMGWGQFHLDHLHHTPENSYRRRTSMLCLLHLLHHHPRPCPTHATCSLLRLSPPSAPNPHRRRTATATVAWPGSAAIIHAGLRDGLFRWLMT